MKYSEWIMKITVVLIYIFPITCKQYLLNLFKVKFSLQATWFLDV